MAEFTVEGNATTPVVLVDVSIVGRYSADTDDVKIEDARHQKQRKWRRFMQGHSVSRA